MAEIDEAYDVVLPVVLGGHRIGPGQRTFVIAEAGVNHDGSTEKALQLVEAAADAGADAVKFQVFRAADLVTESAQAADYQQKQCGAESQRAMLERLELSDEMLSAVRHRCRERSILLLATPFGPAEVNTLAALRVAAIKIASTDLTNEALLDVASNVGVPLIVSTGAATEDEIRSAVKRLQRRRSLGGLIFLHCVSCYPAPPEALNLRAIAALQRISAVPCGFSDHSRLVQSGAWAVLAGACVLEKHFTLDRASCGPDHAMSLNPQELADYVAAVRLVESALGDGRLGATDLQADVRSAARRSIVTARSVSAGMPLVAADLSFKRPGTGIAPGDIDRVIGRRAATDIPDDTLLTWEMLS